MSPSTDNFIHSLVEMSKAFEELPQVRNELDMVRHDLDSRTNTVQRLEAKLIDRANEIDALNAKIKELEAAKDETEYRFLEAEERTHRALDFIKNSFGSAGALIQSLEPPKPEPEAHEVPVPLTGAEGQSEQSPTAP